MEVYGAAGMFADLVAEGLKLEGLRFRASGSKALGLGLGASGIESGASCFFLFLFFFFFWGGGGVQGVRSWPGLSGD